MIKSILLLQLLVIVNLCYGQNIEPIDLAKKLLSKETFTDIDKFSIGEFNGHPNGQDLIGNPTLRYKLLDQTSSTAVVNITIKDSLNQGFDSYLHLKKDTIWKIEAFRSLAMTGILEQAIIEFEMMSDSQIDSVIQSDVNGGYKMFNSCEDYHNQLGNMKLTVEFDNNIIEHFNANRAEFEKLNKSALSEVERRKLDDERSFKLLEEYESNYKSLFISSIQTGGYDVGNCINFLIGGMIDNTVGYLFVRDIKDLPKMTSKRIIMIREIGNGWYLYKTT